jgi:exoribonuclease R
MRDASGRARAYERAVVDLLETYVLEDRAGDTFRGMIVGRGRGQVTVQLVDPAIITAVAGDGLAVGHWVDVRLVSADEAARHLEWEVVGRG